jgi:hypothetical protein
MPSVVDLPHRPKSKPTNSNIDEQARAGMDTADGGSSDEGSPVKQEAQLFGNADIRHRVLQYLLRAEDVEDLDSNRE